MHEHHLLRRPSKPSPARPASACLCAGTRHACIGPSASASRAGTEIVLTMLRARLPLCAAAVVAVPLLIAGIGRHYGYRLPDVDAPGAWNIGGSVAILVLIAMVLKRLSRAELYVAVPIACWWMCEEFLVIGCTTWRWLGNVGWVQGEQMCDGSVLGIVAQGVAAWGGALAVWIAGLLEHTR